MAESVFNSMHVRNDICKVGRKQEGLLYKLLQEMDNRQQRPEKRAVANFLHC